MTVLNEDEMISGMHSAVAKTPGASEIAGVSANLPDLNVPDEQRKLRSMVDRAVAELERRLEFNKESKDVIAGIVLEAKSNGYSKGSFMDLVKRNMETPEEEAAREARHMEVERMMAALGDYASSPLGSAAVSRSKH